MAKRKPSRNESQMIAFDLAYSRSDYPGYRPVPWAETQPGDTVYVPVLVSGPVGAGLQEMTGPYTIQNPARWIVTDPAGEYRTFSAAEQVYYREGPLVVIGFDGGHLEGVYSDISLDVLLYERRHPEYTGTIVNRIKQQRASPLAQLPKPRGDWISRQLGCKTWHGIFGAWEVRRITVDKVSKVELTILNRIVSKAVCAGLANQGFSFEFRGGLDHDTFLLDRDAWNWVKRRFPARVLQAGRDADAYA